jgi:hypothetical protein
VLDDEAIRVRLPAKQKLTSNALKATGGKHVVLCRGYGGGCLKGKRRNGREAQIYLNTEANFQFPLLKLMTIPHVEVSDFDLFLTSSVEMLCRHQKRAQRRVQSSKLMERFPILHFSLLLKLLIADKICDCGANLFSHPDSNSGTPTEITS